MSGQAPTAGYVLTASDSAGDTTWSSPGGVSGWTVSGNNVYETAGGNVGIGTTFLTTSALTVMNGNVGIGTWLPGGSLIVQGGNVGIGTFAPQTLFTVVGGNVGIGTWTAAGGNLIVNGGGNVGIGSAWPGRALDVNGTARMTGFTLTGNGANNGYVMVGNSVGIGTWMPFSTLGTSSQWITTNVNDVYLPNFGNVGIGTNNTAGAALAVMNGNVGIGTWVPGMLLDVKGTIRTTNITMSGQAPTAGYVLTASDSAGDTTWSSPGGVSGWTVSGNNVYETAGGNVGIGTTFLTTSALTVMNGNVGIGTWVPGGSLIVQGGNVGIGTFAPQTLFTVVGGNVGIGTWTAAGGNLIVNGGGNVGIGSAWPGRALDVNGTARMTGFTLTGNGANNGYVMVGNSVGIGTWMPFSTLGTSSQWITTNVNDVYLPNFGNVGIGTNNTAGAALAVMNGNVGIGTWVPGMLLDVKGQIRTTNFTMSEQAPTAGYVLTASDSAGDTT